MELLREDAALGLPASSFDSQIFHVRKKKEKQQHTTHWSFPFPLCFLHMPLSLFSSVEYKHVFVVFDLLCCFSFELGLSEQGPCC
jgi:hypothetical protein